MSAFSKLDADRIMKRLERLAGRKLDSDVRVQVQRDLARGVFPELVESKIRMRLRESKGVIQRKRSRRYGVWFSVLEAKKAGLDDDGGTYVTMCEDHGTVCYYDNLDEAKKIAPTLLWCDRCQEDTSGK
jgi:hypothetical protein